MFLKASCFPSPPSSFSPSPSPSSSSSSFSNTSISLTIFCNRYRQFSPTLSSSYGQGLNLWFPYKHLEVVLDIKIWVKLYLHASNDSPCCMSFLGTQGTNVKNFMYADIHANNLVLSTMFKCTPTKAFGKTTSLTTKGTGWLSISTWVSYCVVDMIEAMASPLWEAILRFGAAKQTLWIDFIFFLKTHSLSSSNFKQTCWYLLPHPILAPVFVRVKL